MNVSLDENCQKPDSPSAHFVELEGSSEDKCENEANISSLKKTKTKKKL